MHSEIINSQKAQHITQCLQLAIMLEVSVDKPGNVSFVSNFKETRIEHFLASAVAALPCFHESAQRGILINDGKIGVDKAGLGGLIKTCSKDISTWQRGGNTILGTVMLFVPIAVAAGMTPTGKNYSFDLSNLRSNIDRLVKATSAVDSVELYEAVDIASPSGLGDSPDFDVNDPSSKDKLLKENVTLFEVFKIAQNYDDVCYEWINNYTITFDLAYPYLMDQLKNKPLNAAVVNLFLKILSERPDSFIARKMGKAKAVEVSKDARSVLELGGLETQKGRDCIREFDKKLRLSGNKCNPGTTADLIATTLAICTLSGYRP